MLRTGFTLKIFLINCNLQQDTSVFMCVMGWVSYRRSVMNKFHAQAVKTSLASLCCSLGLVLCQVMIICRLRRWRKATCISYRMQITDILFKYFWLRDETSEPSWLWVFAYMIVSNWWYFPSDNFIVIFVEKTVIVCVPVSVWGRRELTKKKNLNEQI